MQTEKTNNTDETVIKYAKMLYEEENDRIKILDTKASILSAVLVAIIGFIASNLGIDNLKNFRIKVPLDIILLLILAILLIAFLVLIILSLYFLYKTISTRDYEEIDLDEMLENSQNNMISPEYLNKKLPEYCKKNFDINQDRAGHYDMCCKSTLLLVLLFVVYEILIAFA